MQFAHADSMLLSRQSPNALSATAAYLGRYDLEANPQQYILDNCNAFYGGVWGTN